MKQIKVFSTIKDNIDDQNQFDMDDTTKYILEFEYNQLPKQTEVYVKSFDLIENIKMNQKYMQVSNNIARRKADRFNLNDEMLCEVIDRMEKEADEYIDYQELLEYFTRRGRPKFAESKDLDLEFKEKYVILIP